VTQVSKYYLPNIDGLRFVAAMLVIIHHISPIAGYMGGDVVFNNVFTKVARKLGVTLFLY
jgi:peptidoglycan/LPS O-acetylase OafA/YrhL